MWAIIFTVVSDRKDCVIYAERDLLAIAKFLVIKRKGGKARWL